MPEFPIVLDVTTRYGDLGPDGRTTTIALARWFEDARVAVRFGRFARLLESGDLGRVRVLLATQHLVRHAPIGWQSKIRVGIGIRRVGRTSFTYGYGVLVDDELLGSGETVTVFAGDQGPIALPDELRADLEEMALDEPEVPAPARPGPERAERAHYPFSLPLRARVGDIDTNSHANNVALVSWYAEAVAAAAGEMLGSGWGGPPPELAPTEYRVQYVAEVGYPADYTLGLAVAGYDAAAVRYELGLFHGERCVGLADATGARGELPATALDALAAEGTVAGRGA